MGRTNSGTGSRQRPTSRRAAPQAQRGSRPRSSSRPASGTNKKRLGWARRIGVAFGLLIAVVSVAFAAQALGPGGRHPSTSAGGTPSLSPGALAGLAPPILSDIASPTGATAIDVHGTLAAPLPDTGSYRVRIYVNNRFRRDALVSTGDTSFTVGGVPLVAGTNSITATLGSGSAETEPSAPVTVERDATAPTIDITAPAPGTTVYGDTLLLRGTSEPGTSLTLINRTTSARSTSTAADTGDFSLSLHLQLGNNVLEIDAVDSVGNTSQRNLTIARAVSKAAVTVELSRASYELTTLPQAITMTAHVIGPDGAPADGATVTFSISPPGQTTVTRQTTTVGGVATWSDYPLTLPGAVVGSGLVTVLATVADGESLAGSATFEFR